MTEKADTTLGALRRKMRRKWLMMRSLYSGVAGLKTHQTKMDVIGNNIANVNTVGFKASNVNFSDLLYQTTKTASAANDATGTTGTNAKQIGIGTKVASITTTVGTSGGSQNTDNALDCMINGDAFYVVKYGGELRYTKAGSFFVDGSGTLCTAAGAAVMGWGTNEAQVNEDIAQGKEAQAIGIVRTAVKPLTVMSAENLTSAPQATTNCYLKGNVDSTDPELQTKNGVAMQVNFYDKLGNSYNMQLKLTSKVDTNNQIIDGQYDVAVSDIVDKDGQSIFWQYKKDANGNTTEEKELTTIGTNGVTFGGVTYTATIDPATYTAGQTQSFNLTPGAALSTLNFNAATGKFDTVLPSGASTSTEPETLTLTKLSDAYEDVKIDFSTITQYAANGKCSLQAQRGMSDGSGTGAGRAMGKMTGLSVDEGGKIYGSYDNGETKLLGQISVATFANATGLESVGNSMFATTQNSGDFDGIGQDVQEAGGSISTGVLEMSNVDLSSEFTNMITTQRGFQANSRIITTSDSMLEELINLKR